MTSYTLRSIPQWKLVKSCGCRGHFGTRHLQLLWYLVLIIRRKLYYLLVSLQINNPDMRVVILQQYAMDNFPETPLLNYALKVEKITTAKVRHRGGRGLCCPWSWPWCPFKSFSMLVLSGVLAEQTKALVLSAAECGFDSRTGPLCS